jgi:hypothetical protein
VSRQRAASSYAPFGAAGGTYLVCTRLCTDRCAGESQSIDWRCVLKSGLDDDVWDVWGR